MRLEERSAFIVNWCGVIAQRTLKAWNEGVSTRVLHKVLANALIDAHLLSASAPVDYAFRGVGELVWAPNRFGGLGEVVPASPYSKIQLAFGLFPSIIDLFGLGLYRKYGFKDVKVRGTEHYLVFADDIELKQRLKSPVEMQEQIYWEMLTNIYTGVQDADRDALASCRSRSFAFYSLMFQLAHWRRDMRLVFDRVAAGRSARIDEFFALARTSKKQLLIKVGYWRTIPRYRMVVAEAAKRSELTGKVPTVDPNEAAYKQKLSIMLKWVPAFEAVHEICKAAYAGISNGNPEFEALRSAIEYLGGKVSALGIGASDNTRWTALLTARPIPQQNVARKTLSLIDKFVNAMEQDVGVDLRGLEVFYRDLLTSAQYPLPYTHFKRGY